jgi:hypothetical protein
MSTTEESAFDPLKFFEGLGPKEKLPIDIIADLLNDPNKLQSLQQQIKESPHRKQDIIRSVTGFETAALSRTNELARRLKQPYYKKEIADQVKKLADAMLGDRIDRKLCVKDYGNKTLSTLYGSFSQGLQYLCDHMDPTGTYKEFSASIEIKRVGSDKHSAVNTAHVHISFIANQAISFDLARLVTGRTSCDELVEHIKEFIEQAPTPSKRCFPVDEDAGSIDPFHLKPDEILRLKDFLGGFSFLISNVTSETVMLLKKEPDNK